MLRAPASPAVAATVRSAWLRPSPLALPVACAGCLAAGAVYVAAVDPSDGGGLTACPIRAATGRWCPGCGLTRAAHHALNGEIVPALSFNVLAPVIAVALAVAWWTWMRVALGRGPAPWVAGITWRGYALAAAPLAVFAVVRNLPGWEWLRGGL